MEKNLQQHLEEIIAESSDSVSMLRNLMSFLLGAVGGITCETTDEQGKWCLVHLMAYQGNGKWLAMTEDFSGKVVVDNSKLSKPYVALVEK